MTSAERVWWLIDRVFPTLRSGDDAREREKDENERKECRGRADRLDVEALEGAIVSIKTLVGDEDERRKGIDTRLGTIVGLGSIAGSIVIGATLAQPATMAGHGLAMRVLLGTLTFYITLQLCIAVYWAIRGLNRRNYSSLTPDDFLPVPDVPIRKRLRDQMATLVEVFQQNRSTNNEKMSAMAVAHRASQNFIVGLGFLSLVGVLMFLIGPAGVVTTGGQPRSTLASSPKVQAPARHAPIPAVSSPGTVSVQPRNSASVPVGASSSASTKR